MTEVAQRTSDEILQALNRTGAQAQEFAWQSSQNFTVMTETGSILARGFQDLSQEWFGLLQGHVQRNYRRVHCPRALQVDSPITSPFRANWSGIGCNTRSRRPQDCRRVDPDRRRSDSDDVSAAETDRLCAPRSLSLRLRFRCFLSLRHPPDGVMFDVASP